MALPIPETGHASNARTTSDPGRTSSVATRRLARILDDGLQFGKYRVLRLIAIGGMSEIYEAVHVGLDKSVALKVMRRDLAENPTARQRFIAEGVNAARLQHTNVVDVTDVGEIDELPYLVMALLEGEDLGSAYDRQGRIAPPELVDLLLPVAAAVALGHAHGVVHRDLKPDNIFLHREGCRIIPKVLDFGVSRVMTARRITLNSSVFGTPHYMSPEQARGGPTDARSDQYSLGVILYEGVTGHLPRDSSNPIELLHAVAYDSFRPPSDYLEVPRELEAVILRAMAREPAERYASMRDFAIALLPFASDPSREYWSLELQSSGAPETAASLPQTARHPSPAPAALARASRYSLGVTNPGAVAVSGTDIVVSRASPPPPPPAPGRRSIAVSAHLLPDAEAREALDRELAAVHRASRRRLPRLALAVALLLGGVATGAWFWQRGPGASSAASGAHEVVDYFDVDVAASPLTAAITLDGSNVATGRFASRLRRDGVEHELRASAEGFREASVKFRDAPPPKTIELEPNPQLVATRSDRPQPPLAAARTAPRRVTASLGSPAPVTQPAPSRANAPGVGIRRTTTQPAEVDDVSNNSPHVAAIDAAKPKVRIVDELEPKVRLVE